MIARVPMKTRKPRAIALSVVCFMVRVSRCPPPRPSTVRRRRAHARRRAARSLDIRGYRSERGGITTVRRMRAEDVGRKRET